MVCRRAQRDSLHGGYRAVIPGQKRALETDVRVLEATLRVRFSVWRDGLPVDALPQGGALEVRVAAESELSALPYAKP